MTGLDLIMNGEIVLEGVIMPEEYADMFGTGVVCAAHVRAALAEFEGKDVTVRVNSPGGDPTEGEAIRVMLAEHDGAVTAKVTGDASSAASLMIMGAGTIEMSLGSVMMIHDPAMITMGDQAAHEKGAEILGVLAETYAGVYAERSGKSVSECRAIMRAETWFGPDEAVAAGFADRVGRADGAEPSPTTMSRKARNDASDRHAEAIGMLQSAMDKAGKAAPTANPATGDGGHNQAAQAKSKEFAMSKSQTPAATPEPVATPAPAQIDVAAETKKAVDSALSMERERVASIREIARPFMADGLLTEADIDAKIADGSTVDAAGSAFLATMAERRPATPSGSRAKINRDADETQVEGMIGALSASMFGRALEGPAQEYRGLTMKKLAIELSGQTGFAHNDTDRVKAGMLSRGRIQMAAAHSVSDFTYVTGELMNRELRAAYDSRPGTYRKISRRRTANDFRSLYSVQAGVDTEMKKILADGEYESTVLTDAGETFKVERYGRKVLLTFEAVVNDDLGAFERLPTDFARGAFNLESRIAWGLINANGNLADGTALFATSAGRKNLASSGAVISATTVGAARKAMWEQRPLGAKATGDDFISAVPDQLFVPPALEVAALQFTAATVPTTDANTNPFKGTLTPNVEPRLGAAVSGGSDTAWYLFDSMLPVLEHAFLQGYEAPMVQTLDRMDPDGITIIARHIFGAGTVEFRGAFKNPGA